MHESNHAQIFMAYLGRLTLNDVDQIMQCERFAWQAGLNLGASAQLQAHNQTFNTIYDKFKRMTDHDKNSLERILALNVNKNASEYLAASRGE